MSKNPVRSRNIALLIFLVFMVVIFYGLGMIRTQGFH
jgi:hypothetical protein